jgi:hypothetical protein
MRILSKNLKCTVLNPHRPAQSSPTRKQIIYSHTCYFHTCYSTSFVQHVSLQNARKKSYERQKTFFPKFLPIFDFCRITQPRRWVLQPKRLVIRNPRVKTQLLVRGNFDIYHKRRDIRGKVKKPFIKKVLGHRGLARKLGRTK